MPTHFSPLLIAALLLSNFVIAQIIGLRPVKNLHETIGLDACTTITLIVVAIIDWPLMHFVIWPLGLSFLHNFIAVLLIAVSAHAIEIALRNHYPKFFPTHGNFLPLIIVNCLILTLPLLSIVNDIGFTPYVTRTVALGLSAAALLVVFQTLREHSATAEIPLPFRGAAIDMISAGILIAACHSIMSIF